MMCFVAVKFISVNMHCEKKETKKAVYDIHRG